MADNGRYGKYKDNRQLTWQLEKLCVCLYQIGEDMKNLLKRILIKLEQEPCLFGIKMKYFRSIGDAKVDVFDLLNKPVGYHERMYLERVALQGKIKIS